MVRHLALGRADYLTTLDLQRRLHALRQRDEISDIVLSVEHHPVITMGRSSSSESLLVSSDTLSAHGIQLVEVERGGGVTYHGPGQLVLYLILHLRRFGRDVHRFVWTLEEAMIAALRALSVTAERVSGRPGVWVGERKIASIGIYVRRWVTLHGLALNVHVEDAHFGMIRPCGLPVRVVSVNDLTNGLVTVAAMQEQLLKALETVWKVPIESLSDEEVIQLLREASSLDSTAPSHT